MESVFITGTGTGIGKSAVSLALCCRAAASGLKTGYYKPVQCGRSVHDGTLAGDADWIKSLCPFEITVHTSYEYLHPVSPHLAAEMEGIETASRERIAEDYFGFRKALDFIVVEGAGGAAVPLDRNGLTFTDIMKNLGLRVVTVCAPGLGTINHSLLTFEHLACHGINPGGFIMCHTSGEIPAMFEDNVRTIRELAGQPFLGQIPYMERLAGSGPLSLQDAEILYGGLELPGKSQKKFPDE